ncbi:MAG: type II toxin-antitoxin system RelE/ParE family toxin [Desulfovibrio sp.]|nr:type II toxin-antitoxin system RelE/ParE family toxin [Desulfovibrio sp.]
MNLFWTPQATEDRKQIFTYIFEHSKDAAETMDKLFVHQAEYLLNFPELGKPGRVPGTCEFTAHKHYILVYSIGKEQITILTVLHTSRQWPPLTGDNAWKSQISFRFDSWSEPHQTSLMYKKPKMTCEIISGNIYIRLIETNGKNSINDESGRAINP